MMRITSETKLLLQLIDTEGRNVSARLSKALAISRQAASARIRSTAEKGLIEGSGRGPGVFYRLKPLQESEQTYERQGLSEDRAWTQVVAPLIKPLPENVAEIWHYGITEMVNNAIDHSDALSVTVGISQDALHTRAWVYDNGIGIFEKIQKALNLDDPREAILELAKGKYTTDPRRHSGEGIFFSSKLFDQFEIRSRHLQLTHHPALNDWLMDRNGTSQGTWVMMRLANYSERIAQDVFNKFAKPDTFTFAKTIVPVRLAQHGGEGLVSRSQAKRLVFRFEKFETIILDFEGIKNIGQGFADEIFRVFQNAHPHTKLVPVNAEAMVKKMISRAKSHTH